jgi:argininosuccinate lyase
MNLLVFQIKVLKLKPKNNKEVSKIWDKGYNINKEVEKFTVDDDYILDQNLLFWDCVASIAHSKMLAKINLISNNEYKKLKSILIEIINQDKQGLFKIKQEQEDCHTAIEQYLIEILGDTGKKIHTARSRNDQVMVALKLYMKKELIEIEELAKSFANVVLEFAKQNNVAMPGYTHMQKAMPSTVGLWATQFVESMIDNIKQLQNIYGIIDSNPLGSGAGYGSSFNIDREYTTKLLGFSKTQKNSIYVQLSRGKNESNILSSLMNIMLDINKIATDLCLFTMSEFSYFKLPIEFTTGSSMMPQKKNPDVLELIRAKSKVVESLLFQVTGIYQNLMSGYNRDMQLTKKPLMDGIEITKTTLNIMTEIFKNLEVNEEALLNGFSKEIFATDYANELVKKGVPFREAYKKTAKEIQNIDVKGIYEYIENKTPIGAPGNIGFDEYLNDLKKLDNNKKEEFENCIKNLIEI